ncbi:MAG: helix-turn-helix transcriptional regulator [Ruminiclostridium sp.]|nr:helix-turn-helix transcriptional regulator [Ruminiclostridium sp.]
MEQKKIGKFIAQCRKEKGYTQASLAEKLGITDRAVSKWENGRSSSASRKVIDYDFI